MCYSEALVVQYFFQMAAKTAATRTDTGGSTQAQVSQSLLDLG